MNRKQQWLFEVPFSQMEAEDVRIEQFGALIKLDDAPTHPAVVKAKKGLYVVFRDRTLVYVGQSGNLATRLRSHRLSLTRFKIPTANYRVRILSLPGSTEASRIRREQIIRSRHRIALKHQRPTSEAEYRF
jgi:hypothetical protein